jgi:hypothetical protein
VFVTLAAVGIGRRLWHSEPAYWTRNQAAITATNQAILIDAADRAFNRILGELSDSRGYQATGNGDDALGVRTITLSFDEANAWLATRLNDWLANQKRELPAGLTKPMLASSGESLVAAFHYKNNDIAQVFSVYLSLKFLDDGQAVLSIDGIRGGRLPLPTGSVLKRLPGGTTDDEAHHSRITAVLLGQQPFDPILPIDGTRQARIIGMRVDDKSVSLTVRAEPTGD